MYRVFVSVEVESFFFFEDSSFITDSIFEGSSFSFEGSSFSLEMVLDKVCREWMISFLDLSLENMESSNCLFLISSVFSCSFCKTYLSMNPLNIVKGVYSD